MVWPDEATPLDPLSPADRGALLRLARAAIAAAITHGPTPTLPTPSPALDEPRGAFVSLHQAHRLRGCVGTLRSDQALWLTVMRMALAAAFDDPRFPPLTATELEACTIEISRLTEPRSAHPEEVTVGVHGVCVARGDHRGVFLPQVATEYGWDRERLLGEACLKAMLAPDAWKDPDTTLLAFEAEVFGEE